MTSGPPWTGAAPRRAETSVHPAVMTPALRAEIAKDCGESVVRTGVGGARFDLADHHCELCLIGHRRSDEMITRRCSWSAPAGVWVTGVS